VRGVRVVCGMCGVCGVCGVRVVCECGLWCVLGVCVCGVNISLYSIQLEKAPDIPKAVLLKSAHCNIVTL